MICKKFFDIASSLFVNLDFIYRSMIFLNLNNPIAFAFTGTFPYCIIHIYSWTESQTAQASVCLLFHGVESAIWSSLHLGHIYNCIMYVPSGQESYQVKESFMTLKNCSIVTLKSFPRKFCGLFR